MLVRAVVAPPADVKAHAVGRNVSQRVVERLDAKAGELAIVRDAHVRVNLPGVGEVRVVDLQDVSGLTIASYSTFIASAMAFEVRLVARIVLVAQPVLDRAGGYRRQERLGRLDTGQPRPEVRDVRLHGALPDVGQRPDTDGLAARQISAAGEVLGEFGGVATVDLREHALARSEHPFFDATQPLARIGGEVALGLLAVVDDVEPGGGLLPHHAGHRVAHLHRQRIGVVRRAFVFGGQQDAQGVRPGQAAGVGRQDAFATTFHRGPAGLRL